MRTRIRARPLVAFFAPAFLVTMGRLGPQALRSHGLIPVEVPLAYLAGSGRASPHSSCCARARPREGTHLLVQALPAWRVPIRWYAVALP